MSKADELRNKTPKDLLQMLLDLRRKQFSLRMQRGSGQIARASEIRETKKAIARVKTVMRETDRGGV
ncbi:MAG: 50S ribosomal protein L29 [Pseudomonadota bacterium]|nr:50S ribosomal protein L29 [Pseudomonadota bacterium]